MKNRNLEKSFGKRKMIFVTFLILSLMSLAACQQMPGSGPQSSNSADQLISEGIKKLSEVKSSSLNASIQADLKGPEGQAPANLDLFLKMEGGFDMTDIKDLKMNMKASAGLTADQDSLKGEGELRINKDALFVNLMKLDAQGRVNVPEEVRTNTIGKWWKLAIPAEVLNELAQSIPRSDTQLTENQQKLKTAFENTKFFHNAKYADTQSVMGQESDRYTAMLDKKALFDFILLTNELEGTKLTDSERKQMEESFEKFEFTGDVYLEKNTGIINKIAGVFKLVGGNTDPSGDVTVDFSMGDFNKPITVEVPSPTEEIPLEALLRYFRFAPTIESSIE